MWVQGERLWIRDHIRSVVAGNGLGRVVGAGKLSVFAKLAIESFGVGRTQLRDDLTEREVGFLLLDRTASARSSVM
mgnify:CR=1 FL=1